MLDEPFDNSDIESPLPQPSRRGGSEDEEEQKSQRVAVRRPGRPRRCGHDNHSNQCKGGNVKGKAIGALLGCQSHMVLFVLSLNFFTVTLNVTINVKRYSLDVYV